MRFLPHVRRIIQTKVLDVNGILEEHCCDDVCLKESALLKKTKANFNVLNCEVKLCFIHTVFFIATKVNIIT